MSVDVRMSPNCTNDLKCEKFIIKIEINFFFQRHETRLGLRVDWLSRSSPSLGFIQAVIETMATLMHFRCVT